MADVLKITPNEGHVDAVIEGDVRSLNALQVAITEALTRHRVSGKVSLAQATGFFDGKGEGFDVLVKVVGEDSDGQQ